MSNVNKKGFTLIELLVVVAVIGVLASVILVGLAGFRGRGRDARRIGDLRQVQNGLELFFNACGSYPAASDWNGLVGALRTPNSDSARCAGGPASIGITQVPVDPGTTVYLYGSAVSDSYTLGATLEEANTALNADIDGSSNGVNCGVSGSGDTVYCTSI
ncbi:MAG: prepilin-type N-terminal cleavage/methylation domain-containing protein [Candidatus Liptonbacteria bacterium]|nr:prepilin-type N-terminal cleavage/methylation domain-containing protein [Candidatus Liptonbacteria bacterium]